MKEIQHVFRNYHSAALSTRRKILSATVMALASFRLATVRVTTGYNKSQLSYGGIQLRYGNERTIGNGKHHEVQIYK